MNQNMYLFNQNFNGQQIDNYSAVTKKKYRNKFTPQEDEQLKELVTKYGVRSWAIVSSYLPNRSPRQCRERWKHYLSCDTTEPNKEWTEEEDAIILKNFQELGAKWTKIARLLPGRSDLQVKMRCLKHLQPKEALNSPQNDGETINLPLSKSQEFNDSDVAILEDEIAHLSKDKHGSSLFSQPRLFTSKTNSNSHSNSEIHSDLFERNIIAQIYPISTDNALDIEYNPFYTNFEDFLAW